MFYDGTTKLIRNVNLLLTATVHVPSKRSPHRLTAILSTSSASLSLLRVSLLSALWGRASGASGLRVSTPEALSVFDSGVLVTPPSTLCRPGLTPRPSPEATRE